MNNKVNLAVRCIYESYEKNSAQVNKLQDNAVCPKYIRILSSR